jgi:hypothetical protein
VRQYIGAQMPPAPLLMAHRIQKMTNLLGKKYHKNYLLAGRIKRSGPNISVRRAYFHTNHLLTGLYIEETEIRLRKDDGNIKQ